MSKELTEIEDTIIRLASRSTQEAIPLLAVHGIEQRIDLLKGKGYAIEVITTPEDHTFAKLSGHNLIAISDGVSLVVKPKETT